MLVSFGLVLLVLFFVCWFLAEAVHHAPLLRRPRSETYPGFFGLFYRAAVLLSLLFITVMVALSLDGLVLLSDGVVACTAAGGGQP